MSTTLSSRMARDCQPTRQALFFINLQESKSEKLQKTDEVIFSTLLERLELIVFRANRRQSISQIYSLGLASRSPRKLSRSSSPLLFEV